MRLDAGHGLNLERAERFIAAIDDLRRSSDPLHVDLSNCRHIDPGAGWRLGNSLRIARKKRPLLVHVPQPPPDFSRSWFKHFTRSGLGHAIACHASQILSPEKDITDEVRSYYEKPRRQRLTVEGLDDDLWASENFIYITRIAEASLDVNDDRIFAEKLAATFPMIPLQPEAYGKLESAGSEAEKLTLLPIIQLLFEATQNCYDHAKRKPLPRGTPTTSYLSLRYYKSILPRSISPEFQDYLHRAERVMKGQPLVYTGAFVEIVVNDDGVGVAARHSLTNKVYRGPFREERAVLLSALNTQDSVKLRSQDSPVRGDPGYGFTKIRDALQHVTAFAALRTGRLLATFDSTVQPPHRPPFSGGAASDVFRPLDTPLGYMPGTCLQVVFPHRQLSLFSDGE